MNFSDETVEKVARKICGAWGYLWDGDEEDGQVAPEISEPYDERPSKQLYREAAQAALSSLTLADLMQVEEVRGLVEAARSAFQEYDKTDDGAYYSKMDDLLNAITPFTEPK